MATRVNVTIHPDAAEVGAGRPVLDALQAALDLIRDDMDAEADAAMEPA